MSQAFSLRDWLRTFAWLVFAATAAGTLISIAWLQDIKTGVFFFLGLSFAFALIYELEWSGHMYIHEIWSWRGRRKISEKIPFSANLATFAYFAAIIVVLVSFASRTPIEPMEARYAALAFAGVAASMVYTILRRLRIE